MSREIKFKAWDSESGEMVKDSPDLVNDSVFDLVNDGDAGYFGDCIAGFLNKRHILRQYTGLHDKNGKEIYEGDILERQQIETWDETGKATCVVEDIRFLQHIMFHEGYEIEVIGNIYENPELIK